MGVRVRSPQALWHSRATMETDYLKGGAAGRSVKAGGIQTGEGFLGDRRGGVRLMVTFPPLGSEANPAGLTEPPSRRASAGSRPSFGPAAA
jgi:hypothetical protein